jgi:hypothetical protein
MDKPITLILLLISITFFSQDCKKQIENPIKDIKQTSDGDFVFISDNYKITKVNSDFDTIWHNDNLDSGNNYLSSIHPTLDGGFICSGSGSSGNLFKMNSVGDTIWVNNCQVFFGPMSGLNIIEIIQTADSGYAFVAIYGHMSFYSLLVKTDKFGDTLWTKMNILNAPNSTDSRAKTINETTNGDLVISGLVNTYFPTYTKYSYLYKLNSNGDSLWAKTYDDFQFNYVELDDNENFIIAGEKIINQNTIHPKLIKANFSGDTLWTKSIEANSLNCIRIDNDGGYIIGGSRDYNHYLAKTNLNGDSLWSREFQEDSVNKKIDVIFNLNDNGFLLLGGVKSFSPFSFDNIDRRIKVDSLGFCEGQNTTNTNNFNNDIITVFPNPTKSEITINGYKNLLTTEIFNVMGQKLQTTDSRTISLNNYPSGIYLVKIFSNSGIKDFKIIKQ